jgi:protein gp37
VGERSTIEWTDSTWNPIRARHLATGKIGWHCEHVSEGCRNCYAEGINRRLGTGLDFKPGHRAAVEVFLDEKMLLAPLRWKTPRRIFVNSMTDTFADFVTDAMIDNMFAVMALCPQHQFQVLTKRAERMREYMNRLAAMMIDFNALRVSAIGRATCAVSRSAGHAYPGNALFEWCDNSKSAAENPGIVRRTVGFPPRNVWLGVSAEDQATFEERRQPLRDTPAAVRFLSLEPLLGPIDATHALATGLYHWVIVGGESGPHARPMHPDWVRSLRDQCAAAGVPYFFKQWGAWGPNPGMMGIQCRIGKKAAGRLLDGVQHNAMPARGNQ